MMAACLVGSNETAKNASFPKAKATDDSSSSKPCVLYTTLLSYSDTTRHIFFGIFLIICVFSVLGNVAVIFSIYKRKYRFIQRACIISLALSDLLSATAVGTNLLETLSHPLTNWTIGDFMCHSIPMCQTAATISGSFALVFIAMDRYRNIVRALSKRWDPRPCYCIIAILTFWLASFGLSIPMWFFFRQESLYLIYPPVNNTPFEIVEAHICVTFQKPNLMSYYLFVTVLVFLPLLLIFIWFYYQIASLIWKHRRPVSPLAIFNKKYKKTELESSTSNGKSGDENEVHLQSIMANKNKNVSVERKIRTFKIIVTLMLVFIFCRLPYYIYSALKLVKAFDGETSWIVNYSFTALNIFNCVLNPLLYTFLNHTLNAYAKLKGFFFDICCFCFSHSDFEEFEKENPFIVEQQPQQVVQNKCLQNRSSRVKFEDVKQLQAPSSQDTNTTSRASSRALLKY